MWCFFFRWSISEALSADRPVSTTAAAHIARCEACRTHQRMLLGVSRELSRQAADRSADAVPVTLHAQVMRAVRGAEPEVAARPPAPASAWVPLTAAAALLIGFLCWLILPPLVPTTRGPTTAPNHTPAQRIVTSIADYPSAMADLSSRLQGLADTPLRSEASSLNQDLATATHFVLACLSGRAAEYD